MTRLLTLLTALLLALPCPAFAAPAAPALSGFAARKVSVTTSWVTVQSLWAASGPCQSTMLIINESTTALNVGGADGDSTTNFAPICKTNCNLGAMTIPADGNMVKVASSSGTLTTVYLVCGRF